MELNWPDSKTYTREFEPIRPLKISTNTLSNRSHFIGCPWWPTLARSSRLSTCWSENIGCTLHSVILSPYTSHQHVRESGLAPNCPGLNQILRLNCERNSDHLT